MAELTMDDVLADDRLQQGPGRLAPEIRQIGGREVGPEDGRNPASIGKARVTSVISQRPGSFDKA